MDIARQGQQVSIVLDQLGLEAALELVAGPPVLVTGIQGITGIEPLHEPREVRPRRADQQVEVVVHQDEGVEEDRSGGHVVAELVEEPQPVGVGEEDRRPPISAGGDVVEGVGEIDARRPGHGLSIPRDRPRVKLIIKA